MRRSFQLRGTIGSVNAFNGCAVGVAVEADTAQSVAAKFEAARTAQPAWAAAGFAHRAACVAKFKALLAENADELASLLSAEVGKPLAHAKGEIANTGPRIQFFLDNVEKHMADELAAPESSGTHEVVRSEALGVLGNVSAWNFPYFVGANVWAPVSDERRGKTS